MFLIQQHIFHLHGSAWRFLYILRDPRFLRSLARQVAAVSVLAIAGIVLIQLAYPRSWSLPQTRIGGESFAFRSRDAIASRINALNTAELRIYTGDKTIKQAPQDIGIQLEGHKDAQQVASYSWKERLVPFSIFTEKREVPTFSYRVDEEKTKAFLASLKANDKPPVDSAVKVEGTTVSVLKGEKGYIYEPDALLPAVKDLDLTKDMAVTLEPQVIEPTIPEQTANDVAAAITHRITTPFIIEANGKKLALDRPTMASWVSAQPKPEAKTLAIVYDTAKIKQSLQQLAAQVYVPATTGSVILHDGEATGRTEGADGRALAIDASTAAVVKAASENQTSAQAVVSAVAPASRVTRTYSRSSKGVQALINYWTQTNGGSYGIAMKTIDGTIAATHNPNKSYTAASFYKLYVVGKAYEKLDMNSPTSTGASVASCIDVTIVRSDNPCGIALGNMVGWHNNDAALRAEGYGSTTLNISNLRTTAGDTALWMARAHGGSIAGGHTASLLGMMNRQIYRAGIPAGSAGMTVGNKVGFLTAEALYHDAAIVYHPKGTYVLVIMSAGSSFGRMADLSRQIAAVMNQ